MKRISDLPKDLRTAKGRSAWKECISEESGLEVGRIFQYGGDVVLKIGINELLDKHLAYAWGEEKMDVRPSEWTMKCTSGPQIQPASL